MEMVSISDLENLIDTTPVGIAVLDLEMGTAVSINQEARRVIDSLRQPEQTPGQLLDTIAIRRTVGSDITFRLFPLVRALSCSGNVRSEEVVLEATDGRSIAVLLNASPVQSGDGDVGLVVVTIQDVTGLQEVERLRAEFFGMVSQELRVPLSSIYGSVMALLDDHDDMDPAERRQFLRIILDQTRSMRDLIGDLIEVARIETGTLPVSPKAAEVLLMADSACKVHLGPGGRNNLKLEIAPDLPAVRADPRRIVHVIGNLLSTAAARSPKSSVLRVSAVRNGAHVEISVTGEGMRLSDERLPHLFRKFPRHEDDDVGNGNGLDLAISRGIIEAHGGRIWAERDGTGHGTRLSFTLPVAESNPMRHPDPADDPEMDQAGGESILLFDDDPGSLRSIRGALSRAGYRPMVTAEPEEMLSLVYENRPHLVLLCQMNDGMELMADILATSDIPVIFITAYNRDRLIAEALDMGAADCMVKPFSPVELVARIGAVLRRSAGHHRSEPSEQFMLGDLTIDYSQRLVRIAGRPVELTATEYRLLFELSVNAGRVLTHDQLLRRVWGPGRPDDRRALRTHLSRLRLKLGDRKGDPTYIVAEPRVGYWMPGARTQEEDST